MTIVAALPVRGLTDGKSRLRDTLPDIQRRALILALLRHVAQALRESGVVGRTVLVSPDGLLLEWAEQHDLGVMPLLQTNSGLIGGLWQATAWAQTQSGTTALLAMHADLPLLDANHVRNLVATLDEAASQPAVVVAGDRHQHGTNALLLRPPGVIPFRFGEQSFVRHQGEAAARGVTVIPYIADALSYDLDTPEDIQALTATHPLVAAALWEEVARLMPLAQLMKDQALQAQPAIPACEVQP